VHNPINYSGHVIEASQNHSMSFPYGCNGLIANCCRLNAVQLNAEDFLGSDAVTQTSRGAMKNHRFARGPRIDFHRKPPLIGTNTMAGKNQKISATWYCLPGMTTQAFDTVLTT
jgi:hypothetical protein